ncbi:GNAT family N-acetyltransferase [Qipengyuania sp. JC766]|uniref:GNAT family N-acetyltransferase n=1 Tax=Qipengyuania sp. JC766 TaxID=3232139 RepID=UPI003459326F
MADYAIRQATSGNFEVLADLFAASVERIGPRAYSLVQVAAWTQRANGVTEFANRLGQGDIIILACNSVGDVAGYAILQPDGCIDHLYCHPDHERRGIGAGLLERCEDEAERLGIMRLYTAASEIARPVFGRGGYRLIGRRDFEIGGVPIHNYAMEKRLR